PCPDPSQRPPCLTRASWRAEEHCGLRRRFGRYGAILRHVGRPAIPAGRTVGGYFLRWNYAPRPRASKKWAAGKSSEIVADGPHVSDGQGDETYPLGEAPREMR